MFDGFGRRIEYLRVSVTDRCNYRCFYCMPEGHVPCATREDVLTDDELTRLIGLFAALGVKRVRITGGEPLVRRDIEAIVSGVRRTPGVDDVSLSTNGHLLHERAWQLRDAGLDRVNVSLDSLIPEVFHAVTGRDALGRVLKGIETAVAAGLAPVKVNTVVMKGVNDGEIGRFLDYCLPRGLDLRFIETMPLNGSDTVSARHYLPAADILARVREHCGTDLVPTTTDHGAGPARYYRLGDGSARVGVISAQSQHFCATCNRVRLTATGDLVLCLGHEAAVPLGRLMRDGATDPQLTKAILAGIAHKPERHTFHTKPSAQPMFRLGG
ncbi:MAG: GTP 3',8-cyclase MoaA [Thiohalomonadaceae bacterium]